MATLSLPGRHSCLERVENLGYLNPQHNHPHAGLLSEALVYRTVLSNLADQDARFKEKFKEINDLWSKSVDVAGSEDDALLTRVGEIENVVLGMPAEMKEGVTEIHCSDSPAIRIPEKLFEIFSKVEKIYMNNSCFSSLPTSIEKATEITSFCFSNAATCSSKLQELPLCMKGLRQLTTLQITSTSIKGIAKKILCDWSRLQFVDISNNDIRPENLKFFKNCKQLRQLIVKEHSFALTTRHPASRAMNGIQKVNKFFKVVDLSSGCRKKIDARTIQAWKKKWSNPMIQNMCVIIECKDRDTYTFGKEGITSVSGG